MELENRKELEELLGRLEGFLNTPIHLSFVSSTKQDLSSVEENLIELDYCTPSASLEAAHLSGQRKVLSANLTLFEDTVERLKSRIQAILNEEQQIPHSTNQVDDEEI